MIDLAPLARAVADIPEPKPAPHRNAHSKDKLTPEDAKEIRRILSRRMTQQALAELYGVSQATISRVNRRNRWK
jgi:DNA invertase Pin-like site-specific DNA recombinase